MNYFLILGVVVIIIFFIALLVNNLSQIVNQSETKDMLFTFIGLFLALSIFTSFFLAVYYLNDSFNKALVVVEKSVIVEPSMIIQDHSIMNIRVEDRLLNVIITPETKYVNNKDLAGKLKLKEVSYEAPEVWYMMEWKLNALNKNKYLFLDTVYQ